MINFENRIDGSVLIHADQEMLKELHIDVTNRNVLLKSIESMIDSGRTTDIDSLLEIVSRNDRTIIDLQTQIEIVKKDLTIHRSNIQPNLVVKTGARTSSALQNAEKMMIIIPLGHEERRVQISEKELCKAVIADTLSKLKISSDWKEYVMLLQISKKSKACLCRVHLC
jgi:hypothetical protein